jgi:hypothetical protein
MNNYIHILDADGKRITSIVDNIIEPIGETALREQAKSQYPNATQYIYGDDDMLDQFLGGKIYVSGKFVDAPVVEYIPTKAEKIAYIKKYYDARFATLDKALVRRRLINGDITDLQEQFNQLILEMVAKIKAVK